MHIKLFAALAAGVIVAALSHAALAQNSGLQRNSYRACMNQAVTGGITGDELSRFMDSCLAQVATGGAAVPTVKQCESQAAGLYGDARNNFLNSCTQRMSSAASASGPSFSECRSRAAAQSLTGDTLTQYMETCVGR